MTFPSTFWIGFFVFILGALAIDLGMACKNGKDVSFRSAFNMTMIWVFFASVFCSVIYFYSDKQKALEFITGYVIELSLSMDNVFVFTLIFSYFRIPKEHQHRVLFYGIIGAIAMRLVMIVAGVYLLAKLQWLLYIFGAILIYSAFKITASKDDTASIENMNVKFIDLIKRFLPVTNKLHGQSFVVKIGKKFYYTPLFIVLLIVEKTDLIFAIDSIPAIMAISKDTFIIFTSNIFAILGLRSLYFLLANLMNRFIYLKHGIALILGFVGIKMLVVPLVEIHIPIQFSLLFIISTLTISVLLSWINTNSQK